MEHTSSRSRSSSPAVDETTQESIRSSSRSPSSSSSSRSPSPSSSSSSCSPSRSSSPSSPLNPLPIPIQFNNLPATRPPATRPPAHEAVGLAPAPLAIGLAPHIPRHPRPFAMPADRGILTIHGKCMGNRGGQLLELLKWNMFLIEDGDSFLSVFERVMALDVNFMEEWDMAWTELGREKRLASGFRQRLLARLALPHREGDLSDLDPVDWFPPVHSRVLHFLRGSDMLRSRSFLVLGMNFDSDVPTRPKNLTAENVSLSMEQRRRLDVIGAEAVVLLERALKRGEEVSRSRFVSTVCKKAAVELREKTAQLMDMLARLDKELQLRGVFEGEMGLLRLLESGCFGGDEIKGLVDGSDDGIVLMALPRKDGVFEASWARAVLAPRYLQGGLQMALLQLELPSLMQGFVDARAFTGLVHHSLHWQMVNGRLSDDERSQYKIGYALVRPLPLTVGKKTLVLKAMEWAHLVTVVTGLDMDTQKLLTQALDSGCGPSQHKTRIAQLEKVLGPMVNIDEMVEYQRGLLKKAPLVVQIWAMDRDASDMDWSELFRKLSQAPMELVCRMLEVRIVGWGLRASPGQVMLLRLLKLALVEMDDVQLPSGLIEQLYGLVNARHLRGKRSRGELEKENEDLVAERDRIVVVNDELQFFVHYARKRLKGCLEDTGLLGDLARRVENLPEGEEEGGGEGGRGREFKK